MSNITSDFTTTIQIDAPINHDQVILDLLPTGRAWPKYADSNLTKVVSSFGPTFDRASSLLTSLIIETRPDITNQLLTEWAESTSLPDVCLSLETYTSDELRRWMLVRVLNNGGSSVSYFIAYAAMLGYTITITEFNEPQVCGVFQAGTELGDPDAPFRWRVNFECQGYEDPIVGVFQAGQPLGWMNIPRQVMCCFNNLKPAHTLPFYVATCGPTGTTGPTGPTGPTGGTGESLHYEGIDEYEIIDGPNGPAKILKTQNQLNS